MPQGYGSHASEGVASLSTRWLFAEGVTGVFYTYVALLNPSPQTARLTVTYFGADGATPIVREHIVAPDSRATIFVNADASGLTSSDLSIAIDSDVPIAAERSIYRDVGSAFWGAGTSSAGAPAPSTQWFFAEGLTNPAFDTYLLLLNAETTAATIEVSVLRADGLPITLTRTIAPRSRATVHEQRGAGARLVVGVVRAGGTQYPTARQSSRNGRCGGTIQCGARAGWKATRRWGRANPRRAGSPGRPSWETRPVTRPSTCCSRIQTRHQRPCG